MRKIIAILALLTIFASCGQSDNKTQEISPKDGSYTVQIPKDMHELKGLNSDANIQYGSLESGITFMVVKDGIEAYKQMIDKNIEDLKVLELFDNEKSSDIYGINGYMFFINQNLASHSDEAKITLGASKDTIINGLSGKWTNYTMKEKNEKSYVELCVLKGDKNYYQIYSMCSLRKQANNLATMQAIIGSFREN